MKNEDVDFFYFVFFQARVQPHESNTFLFGYTYWLRHSCICAGSHENRLMEVRNDPKSYLHQQKISILILIFRYRKYYTDPTSFVVMPWYPAAV